MTQPDITLFSFSGPGYSCSPAYHAKGKMVLRITSDGSGWKTEGEWLAESLGGQWTHRGKGYNLSPNRSVQWLALFKAGYQASRKYFGEDSNPYTFSRENGPKMSLKEALAEAKKTESLAFAGISS